MKKIFFIISFLIALFIAISIYTYHKELFILDIYSTWSCYVSFIFFILFFTCLIPLIIKYYRNKQSKGFSRLKVLVSLFLIIWVFMSLQVFETMFVINHGSRIEIRDFLNNLIIENATVKINDMEISNKAFF
jgi:hypothetical protein